MFPKVPIIPAGEETEILNLAAYVAETKVLGPGRRAGVWVQGCPFTCPGCIAPEWIPQRINQIVRVAELAQRILAAPVTGLTLSGGEPFLQAPALAALVQAVRQVREMDVIIFSGFTLAALQRRPEAASLLAHVDLLIDSGYIAARDRGMGLRGSDNQRFHFLSPRLQHCGYPFETVSRSMELHFQGDEVLVVGIPAHGSQAALDRALETARQQVTLEVCR